MSELHPDREVLVTPLDPAKDDLDGAYPVMVLPGVGRLMMSMEDLKKLEAMIGAPDLTGRRIELSAAEDGVRIRIRAVAS